MKRLILIALIFLTLGTTFLAQTGGYNFRDSTNGIHSIIVFLISNPDYAALCGGGDASACSFLSSIAYRYDFFWGFQNAVMQTQNSQIIKGVYASSTQENEKNTYNRAWYEANHYNWILWYCSTTAPYGPIAPIQEYSHNPTTGDVVPDITNPDVVDHQWAYYNAKGDHIAWDNSTLTNDYEDFVDHDFKQACGVYTSGTHPSGTFNKKFPTGAQDATYMNGFLTYAAEIKSRLHAKTPPVRLIANTDPGLVGRIGPGTFYTNFINAFDAVFSEGTHFGPRWITGHTTKNWLPLIKLVQALDTAGVAFYGQELIYLDSSGMNITLESEIPAAFNEFTYAVYLLAKGQHTALRILPGVDSGGYGLSSGIYWPAAADYTHNGLGAGTGTLGIGTPCEAPKVVAPNVDTLANSTEAMLFAREYTHGYVLINGSVTNSTYGVTGQNYSFTMPTSGPNGTWAYKDVRTGAIVSASQTLGPVVWAGSNPGYVVDYGGRIFLKYHATDTSILTCSNNTGAALPQVTVGPTITSITATGATINATTDIVSDTTVISPNNSIAANLLPAYDATATLSHSKAITGLSPSTSYQAAFLLANANGTTTSATAPFTTSANASLLLTKASLLHGVVGTAYLDTLTASGGTTTGVSGYTYYDTLTFDKTKIPSDRTNFKTWTCNAKTTDPNWQTQANYSGHMANANAYDGGYFSNTGLTSRLYHQVKGYIASSGTFCGWHNSPTLSAASNTLEYFGHYNPNLASSQEDITNLWPSTYKLVVHGNNLLDSSNTPVSFTPSSTPPSVVATTSMLTGLSFNGNQYMYSADISKLLLTTGQFSVKTVINFIASQINTCIVCQYDGSTFGLLVSYLNANKLMFVVNQGGSNFYAETSGTFNDSMDHAVAGWWDGNNVKISVDGVTTTGMAVSGTLATPAHTSVVIGNYHPNTGNSGFVGTITEVMISTAAEDYAADELTAEYNNRIGTSTFYSVGTENAAGGAGGYAFTRLSGDALPNGLALATDGPIAGTPTVAGTSTITFRVTDQAPATNDKELSLVIEPAIIISELTNLPYATGSEFKEFDFSPVNGIPPYVCTLASGTLPTGMVIQSTCKMNGTPTSYGNHAFNICSTDAALPTPSVKCRDYNLSVNRGSRGGQGRR